MSAGWSVTLRLVTHNTALTQHTIQSHTLQSWIEGRRGKLRETGTLGAGSEAGTSLTIYTVMHPRGDLGVQWLLPSLHASRLGLCCVIVADHLRLAHNPVFLLWEGVPIWEEKRGDVLISGLWDKISISLCVPALNVTEGKSTCLATLAEG